MMTAAPVLKGGQLLRSALLLGLPNPFRPGNIPRALSDTSATVDHLSADTNPRQGVAHVPHVAEFTVQLLVFPGAGALGGLL
jgi:hypothetical protein